MENLRLWQELTSTEIPLEDIDEVVYGDGESTLRVLLTIYSMHISPRPMTLKSRHSSR